MCLRLKHLVSFCLLALVLAACDGGGSSSTLFQGGSGSDAGGESGSPTRAEGVCGVVTEDEVRTALGVSSVNPSLKSPTECHWLTADIEELVITVSPADVTYRHSLPSVVAAAIDDPSLKWDSWDDIGDGAYASYNKTSLGGPLDIRIWKGKQMLELMLYRGLEVRPQQAVFAGAETLAEAALVGLQGS